MVFVEAAWYDVAVSCLLENWRIWQCRQSRFSIVLLFFFETGFRGVARIMFFLNGSMLKLQNACFDTRRNNALAVVVENNVFALENW